MEEEKKEVVEETKAEEEKVEAVEPVKAEEAAAERVDDEGDVKNALISFILAAAGIILCETGIGMLILGIVSLALQKKIKGKVEKKPHAVFLKIAKPVAIVDIILGALILVGLFIWLVVWLIMLAVAAAAAAAEMGAEIAVLF